MDSAVSSFTHLHICYQEYFILYTEEEENKYIKKEVYVCR